MAQQVPLSPQLHEREEPMALAVLDTLNVWCSMAETPGHPAQAKALELLTNLVGALHRARELVERQPSGHIAVVRNGSTAT
jgi:hypothetical protein